jgi:hypothetical protein
VLINLAIFILYIFEVKALSAEFTVAHFRRKPILIYERNSINNLISLTKLLLQEIMCV